jgi:endo-alpha-1,4-polygalactosaminidase (GH114 family)
MDWVEAFSDTRVMAKAAQDGTNTVSAMFDFIEKIRTYARQISSNANPDYLVIAQNASDLYQEDTNRYEQLVDAIALEAIWYDGEEGFDNWDDPGGYNVPTDSLYPGWTEEVLGHLEPMQGRLPIFCCEYAQDINGSNLASLVYTNLAPTNGFIPYCTRRSLQRLSKTPYPLNYWPLDY